MLYSQLKKHIVEAGVTTDSRACPVGSIFFALKGEHFNGNAYALKALEAGCALAVVDEVEYVADSRFIYVENVLKALQEVARDHRIALGIPVVAITGTNGKTTTKELTAAVLSAKYSVHCTQGNLNNHIGVPLTLLALKPTHQIAIIEMGASRSGDIKELAEIAIPNAGLITNVGKAHLAGFIDFEGVKATKGELYGFLKEHQGFIFRNLDNTHLAPMAGNIPTRGYSMQYAEAEVYGVVRQAAEQLGMEVTVSDKKVQIQTHLVGAYNAENVLAAIAIGHAFGVTVQEAKTAIEQYVPQNNRSMLVKTTQNTIVVDAYNANPSSMRAAIENFVSLDCPNKVYILGDMLELGRVSAVEHQQIVDLLERHHCKNVYLVGTVFSRTDTQYSVFESTDQLLETLRKEPLQSAHILLKGSRGIKLEGVLSVL